MQANDRRYWGTAGQAVAAGDDDSDDVAVESVGTHVYFYSAVTASRCLMLMQHLRALDNALQYERAARGFDESHPQVPIWLHINSTGGDVFTAFGVADQIRQMRTPVHSIAEGVCASAATIISVACPRRFVQANAYMLIHQFSSWFVGKHEEFKDEMELQAMMIERMVAFYLEHVGHVGTTADELRDMLKRDTWLDAQRAVHAGFAGAILEETNG